MFFLRIYNKLRQLKGLVRSRHRICQDHLRDYLQGRPCSRNYADRITLGKTEQYADLWIRSKHEILSQCTCLLIERLEKGFKNKDDEDMWRQGLQALPNLWKECLAQDTLDAKMNAAKTNTVEKNNTNSIPITSKLF